MEETKQEPASSGLRPAVSRLACRLNYLLLLGVLCAPSLGYLLGIRSGRKTLPYFFETGLLVLLLGLFFSRGGMRPYLSQIRRRHRAQLFGLLIIMLFAQAIGNYRTTFPVMPWTMYQGGYDPPDHVTVYQYFAVTSQGEKIRMNPSRLFPSNGRGYRRMSNKLIHICRDYESELAGKGRDGEAKKNLEDFMRSIGRQFDRKHEIYAVEAVEIHRHIVPWKNADSLVVEEETLFFDVTL